MNEVSNLTQSHIKEGVLSDVYFSQVLKLVEGLADKSDRQSSIEYLLRTIRLSPSQVLLLAHTETLHDNISLQLALKRYVRAQEYASAPEVYENRSRWAKVAEFFFLLSPF